MFTFAAAFCAGANGRVVAVEPDSFCVQLLRMSGQASSPSRARVDIVSAAVSDALGIGGFHIARRGRSSNFLAAEAGSTQTGGVRETVSVITVTLDWLAGQLPPPSVLKIDVEGAEAAVMRGAGRLLAEVKPVLLCEVSSSNAETCSQLLQSHGYILYDFGDRCRGKIATAAWNTLALPG
jgi:FkbM family methyltransferase